MTANKAWTPVKQVERDARVAIVGLAVTYAGCETKEVFFDSLLEGKVQYATMTQDRLDSKNKDLHFLKERSKYSDTFSNDRYAFLDSNKYRHEHDLLLKLSQEALSDYRDQKANDSNLIDLENDEIGVVSGCLSFPKDNQQGELSLLYQAHVEKKLKEMFPDNSILADHSPWSARPEAKTSFEDTSEFCTDIRQRTDPASFVAETLNMKKNTVSYSIDAACATSIYVLRLAQEHLLQGDCDVVLAGATAMPDPFFILSGFSTFQAIPVQGTKDDISAPWRKGSTGLTPGEGGCIVVLKRLEDAVRDNDYIYATMLSCGINNAGRGLPLKPLLDSELSCLRETYALADYYYSNFEYNAENIDRWIQYVECHATGTSQGDAVELEAMKQCFSERKQKLPLFGSSKGNFGHTLVSAGFAGMTKLLLSMKSGKIPPTPALTDENGTMQKMHDNVVSSTTKWPDHTNQNGSEFIRRGALSAFGFGGTNAHAVFEYCSSNYLYTRNKVPLLKAPSRIVQMPELAVLGMDCTFGDSHGLSDFEQRIYSNASIKRSIPDKRWRFLTNDKDFRKTVFGDLQAEIMAGFVEKFFVDFKSLRTPLNPEDLLIPQQLLCLTVLDNAIGSAAVPKGARAAVLVGLGTDLEMYRHKGRVLLKERLASNLLDEKNKNFKGSMEHLLDYIHDRGTSTSYTSYIGNLIATRSAAKHGFTGPCFTVTEGENSSTRALHIGKMMISSGTVDYVVIAGVDFNCCAESFYVKSRNYDLKPGKEGVWFGEGAGAVVLSASSFAREQKKKILANVCGMSSSRFDVSTAITTAHTQAGAIAIAPELLDLSGIPEKFHLSGARTISLEKELSSVIDVFGDSNASIAVSSSTDVVGRTGYASGIAALVKCVLCLYNRYLPASFDEEQPTLNLAVSSVVNSLNPKAEIYMPMYSIPWVRNKEVGHENRRYAAMSSVSESNSYFYLLLRDEEGSHEEENLLSVGESNPILYLIPGSSVDDLLSKISNMQNKINLFKTAEEGTLFLRQLIADTISLDSSSNSKFVFSIISRMEINNFFDELDQASKGIPRMQKLGRDYISRNGSFLALKPNKSSKICAMYGEGRAPYLSLGSQLYRVWPKLHDLTEEWTTNMWPSASLNYEFHPRHLSKEAYEAEKEKFEDDQVRKFKSGVFHSMQFTQFALNVLGVKPKGSFGLSLGEISMYFAFSKSNCLTSNETTEKLAGSFVWRKELGGSCQAIRKHLGLPVDEAAINKTNFDDIWFGYIFPKSRADLEKGIKASGHSKNLRLMIVNNCDSALVSGTPPALEALMEQMGLNKNMVLPVPQRMIGHCPEVTPYLSEIAKIHSELEIPDTSKFGMKMYTNIGHKPVNQVITQKSSKGVLPLGDLAGKIYEAQADFVELMEMVNKDGYDVFVELGADNQRSSAVKNVMSKRFNKKETDYVAVSIDKRSEGCWTNILRMLAVLKSHQVPEVKISQIYHSSLKTVPAKRHKMIREIIPNGRYKGLSAEILNLSAKALKELPKHSNHSLPTMKVMSPPKMLSEKLEVTDRKTNNKIGSSNGHSLKPKQNGHKQLETVVVNNLDITDLIKKVQKLEVGFTVSDVRTNINLTIPKSVPKSFGAKSFLKEYKTKYPIYLGSMWNGISGVEFVVKAAKAGLLATYGSYNLPLAVVRQDIKSIKAQLSAGENFAVNITQNPHNAERDSVLIDFLIEQNVSVVEISRFTSITPELLKLRLKLPRCRIIAKIYEPESASSFLSQMRDVLTGKRMFLEKFLRLGEITKSDVQIFSSSVDSFASDIVCIGSNPAITVLPVVRKIRQDMDSSARIGVAGNIGCCIGALGAFESGADFISTGSINLMAREADVSSKTKELLTKMDSTDVVNLPCYGLNLFDQRGYVPIVKKGTMFPPKVMKLFELFQKYDSYTSIPEDERLKIEKRIFKTSFNQLWDQVCQEANRDSREKARLDSFNKRSAADFEKIKLALVFAKVLKNGLDNCGRLNGSGKEVDALIWCSPSIGAYNDILSKEVGSSPSVVDITEKLMEGMCLVSRAKETLCALKQMNVESATLADVESALI